MARRIEIRWNLRKLMAARGLFNTNDLLPLLAERGVQRSRMQVFRIVTETPDRIDRRVLAALCDILDCTPNDLMELCEATESKKKTGTTNETKVTELEPLKARIKRPKYGK